MRLFPLGCIEKGDWFFNAADQFMICDTSKKDVNLISMTHAFRFSDTLFRLDIRLLFWLSQSLYYICIFIFYFFLLIFSPDQTQYHRDRNIRQGIAYRDVYSHQDPVQDEADYPQYHIGDLNFFFAVIFL